MAIASRPNDNHGMRTLIQDYRGLQLSSELRYDDVGSNGVVQAWIGFRHNGPDTCAISGYAFFDFGLRINGRDHPSQPNTFEVGDYNGVKYNWPLGFDPDGLRMEMYLEYQRFGSSNTGTMEAPVINGNTLAGGPQSINVASWRVYKWLNNRNFDPFGLGELYHAQYANSAPTANAPAESKWFLEEGSGPTTTEEEATRTATMISSTEGVHYEWVDRSLARGIVYKLANDGGLVANGGLASAGGGLAA